jgi:cell wall-associated NlpC family hydrolase
MKGQIALNKLQEFISIVNSKLGTGYVFGGQNDQPLTKAALSALVNKFGKSRYYFSNYSAEKWLGKEYYDCSGLIVYTLRRIGLISQDADYTAQAIYSKLCTAIQKSELRTGDLCFKKSAGGIYHVGIYMGNNRITHARGTFYGVVNTTLFSSFTTFGRLNFFAGQFPEVNVTIENSIKKVLASTEVYEQPYEKANVIGRCKAGSLIFVDGITDNSWYMVNLDGKKGYVQLDKLKDYDELLNAVTLLSNKTGISKDYWYKQAGIIKYLDICFIKIANGFESK